MHDDTDESLMLAYARGEASAFERLYRRHKDPLYRYFLRQCRQAALADELFQETWMTLIKARERYEPRAKFTTYLYRVAHSRLIDHYRRQASGVPLSYGEAEDALVSQAPALPAREPENALELQRQARRLLQLLEQLPDAQREAFLLRQEGGLSIEAIAQATEVNVETAKSRLRYALAKLRSGLAEPHARARDAERG